VLGQISIEEFVEKEEYNIQIYINIERGDTNQLYIEYISFFGTYSKSVYDEIVVSHFYSYYTPKYKIFIEIVLRN
ncbi:hypothetical protein PFDG_05425, partial [Plasmodium falciparum Dd2]